MYLCFIKFYIKFSAFHIADHGPLRRTIGPRAFRAGPARKSAHGPCLGRQAGTMAYGGMAQWHVGHTGSCPIGPCLARARAGPGQPGPLLIFTPTETKPKTKKNQDPSHRILQYIYETLNIDENKN
jgi:hypothetical protein